MRVSVQILLIVQQTINLLSVSPLNEKSTPLASTVCFELSGVAVACHTLDKWVLSSRFIARVFVPRHRWIGENVR